MFEKKHTLFNEIYRPTKLEDYLGDESFKENLKDWIDKNDIPNMLLSGPAGIGKTTIAKLLVKNIDCDWLFINASDERGIDTIREKVVSFASTSTFASLKIVILDEADYLSYLSQPALRGIIEEYSASTRFILTCNYSDKIIPALKSRCSEFKLKVPTKIQIAERVDYILQNENIDYDPKDLKKIINRHYPDIRDILNFVQISCRNGKLLLNLEDYNTNKIIDELIVNLQSNNTNDSFRQLIINYNMNDFTGVYRSLFERISEWTDDDTISECLITLNNYQYQSYFIPDKELNISACILNLKQIINKK